MALGTAVRGAAALRNLRGNVGSMFRPSRGVVTAGVAVAGAAGGLLTAAAIRNSSAVDVSDPYASSTLTFPNDLNKFGNYMEFRAYATNGLLGGAVSSIFASLGGAGFVGQVVSGDGATIRLPLPNSVKADYDPQYDTPSLGPGPAAQFLSAADRAVYGNNSVPFSNAAAATGIAGIGKLIGAALGTTKAGGAIAGALSGGDGNLQAAAFKTAAGLAVNPHKIVLFTGVDFRNHQFSWRLSPRNKRESDVINEICKAFTFYAHPNFVAGGLFLKYPEFFSIKFYRSTYLYDFLPCVLDSISIDYQPMGYAAYKRGNFNQTEPAPAEVQISLAFKETQIITKEVLKNPGLVAPATRTTAVPRNVGTQTPNTAQTTQPTGQVPGTNVPTDTFFGAP